MKILAISCSPRKGGNTETLLNEALKGAKQEGAQVELYSVIDKHLEPCDACRKCVEGECHYDDAVREIQKKMLAADGIIFGTPVYFYMMAAQAKIIMDRTMSMASPTKSLANKVGGVVVVAGSLGLIEAVKDWYFYIITRGMIPANYVAAYGRDPGDVKNLEKCMKAAFDMGRQMVLIANKKFEFPKEIPRLSIAYGTHTK